MKKNLSLRDLLDNNKNVFVLLGDQKQEKECCVEKYLGK